MRAFDIHIDESDELGRFSVAIGPAGRNGAVAMSHNLGRDAVVSLLVDHMHFRAPEAMRYVDAVEVGQERPIIGIMLNDADAAAVGWLSEFDQPEQEKR